MRHNILVPYFAFSTPYLGIAVTTKSSCFQSQTDKNKCNTKYRDLNVSPSHCSKMLFVKCYRPPSAPVNGFTGQLDKIIASATKTYKKVCLLGDFSMSDVHWSHCPSSKNLEQNIFCEMLNVYGLVKLNTIPSIKHDNILDLVISNTPHLSSPVEEYVTSVYVRPCCCNF